MKRFAILSLVAVLTCVLVSAGCNGKRLKGLVPAEGVVTLNGEPVEGATVLFSPKSIGGEAVSAQAITDKNGKFKMTTLDPGDGVYPGEYYVTFMKDQIEGGLSLEEAKLRIEDPDKYRDEKEPEQTVIHYIPTKYADMNTSGITVGMAEGGQKDLQFMLEGEVDLTPQTLTGGHGGKR